MLSAFLGARPHQRAYPNHACVRPPGHQRKQGREREITRDEPRVSSSIVGTSRDPRFARLRAVLDPAHLLGPLSLSTPGSVLMSVEVWELPVVIAVVAAVLSIGRYRGLIDGRP